MSNVNYEMVVSARFSGASDFKTPETTYADINISIHDTTLDITRKIKEIRQTASSGSVKIKIPKGYNPVTDTIKDIIYNWNEEGPAQVIITGIGATATAVGAVAIFGLSAPATAGAAITGLLVYNGMRYLSGKIYDGIWNYGEQIIDWYKDQNGKYVAETSVSDISDIKDLVAPMYGAAADCDINEIEIRVKPNGGGSGGDDGDIEGGGAGGNSATYTIKPGDTVWGICNANGWTYAELIELNPWLADRFSKDGKFALIRPGEKLKLPGGGSALLSSGKPSPDIPFNEADKAGIPGVDPVLIDLNNDGKISTVGVENGTYFDHGNDGFAESSAWVSSEDGILAIDKNNDGIINNGNEIFGDGYNIISIDFVNERYNVEYNNNLDNNLDLNIV